MLRRFFVRIKSPVAVNSAVGCVLVAVLGVLIVRTGTVDFEAHNEVVALLRQLKQVDAEWNIDVLRAKTGLSTSYDPVASPLPLIDSLEAALRRKAGEAWRGGVESEVRAPEGHQT